MLTLHYQIETKNGVENIYATGKDERKYDKIGKMGGVCPDEDFCFISPECSAENEFCTDGNSVSEFRRRVIEGEIKL